jgi:penicillin-insensitive murein endopeptidase
MGTPTPLAPSLTGTIGVPHNGVLTESLELPEKGVGYRRYRPHSPIYFGLPRLVRAIERAAQVVEKEMPGGEPLIVGDLSAETGGKIPRHNSHRTGRDVDFLFYITSPTGIPQRNPGFIPISADGFVRLPDDTYAVLDVRRQWLLFKTLLQDPEIDIQFLFMSRDLEARVMQYALAKETDWELLWHAQTVMLQPGDSLPHADHVHVRIACKPGEAVQGCTGGGPHWPWLDSFPELDVSLEDLVAQIGKDDPFELPPLESEPEPNISPEPSTPPEASARSHFQRETTDGG